MTNIWTIFGHQNILGTFWTTFLVSIGLRIGQNLVNVGILQLSAHAVRLQSGAPLKGANAERVEC